ncbi:hypothetical protein SeLEV6574_g01079 [Synchytrium endobioticum]|uniref:Chloride channel protein n=1 Tax=Synchytrium endobioticum TaxID=286115 RepID=A0A507DFV8_9FUNG|nr:hypothetical protein SeLEV6574_g01079 [Synchytrium endobioticum]
MTQPASSPISPAGVPRSRSSILLTAIQAPFSAEGLSRASTDVLNEYTRRQLKASRTESLDFEEPDGDLLRDHYKRQTPNELLRHDLMGYVVALGLALLVATTRLLIYYITEYILEWRSQSFIMYFEQGKVSTAWGYAFGTSLLFAIPTSILILFEPGASGSGMPEVLAYLNGVAVEKFTTWRTLIFKVIGMIGIVSAGLFSGFEGPMSHVGTIMGILLTKSIRKSDILTRWFYGEGAAEQKGDISNILHVTEKNTIRIFAATGAAIGLAAAFHSPLASTLFVIEEAASFFHVDLIVRTLFACLVAYFLVGGVSMLKKGQNLKHISPVAYSVFAVNASCAPIIAYQDVAVWIFMGLVFGIVGHFYNKVIVYIREVRAKRLVPHPYLRLFEIIVVCLITSLVVIYMPRTGQFNKCTSPLQVVHHLRAVITKAECQATCGSDINVVIAATPACFSAVCLPDALLEVYSTEFYASFEKAANVCPSLVGLERENYVAPPVNLTNVASAFEPEELELLSSPGCETNGYLELATLLFASPERILSLLFIRGLYNLYHPATLVVFGVLYILLSLMVHGIALPTDLVIPNLIIGATAGRLMGMMINFFKERLGQTQVDPGAYALLGMAGFWSGTSRMLVTVMLIAIESTFELDHVPALLVVCVVATTAGNYLGGSMYHMEIHSQKLPFLPHEPPHELKSRRIDTLMSFPVRSVGPTVPLSQVRDILESGKHSGFPVVNEKHETLGLLLRSQLHRKLRSLLSDEGILRDNDLVDVSGIMNKSPHTVVTGTTASKAYIEFRALALRHLLVVNHHHQLVGMVTRKDFLNEEHGLHNAHLRGTIARHATVTGSDSNGNGSTLRRVGFPKISRSRSSSVNNTVENQSLKSHSFSTSMNRDPGGLTQIPDANSKWQASVVRPPDTRTMGREYEATASADVVMPGFGHEMREMQDKQVKGGGHALLDIDEENGGGAKGKRALRDASIDDVARESATPLIPK